MPIQHKLRRVIKSIVGELVDGGYETYLVGGAVRDLMLDIEPKDYDIATAAPPEEVRRLFGRRRSRIIGRRFRLVHVYAHNEIYEVSTFRRAPSPEERRGRVTDDGVMLWRDNAYGTLEEDALRRDYTVNALYYDPIGDKGIVDLVGGVEDLNNRTVRAIGDPKARLEEDPVRLLRALKLVGQYGFTLEDELEQELRHRVANIGMASRARLFEELLKILSGAHAADILSACHRYGLLAHYWPEADADWNGPAGELFLKLLRARGRRVAAGDYSTSKSLALATAVLPAVIQQLGNIDQHLLWLHEGGLESDCRTTIQAFYSSLPTTKYFAARSCDIILLIPRMLEGRYRDRIYRHPEYKYARELLLLLAEAWNIDHDLVDLWPLPQPTPTPEGAARKSPRRNQRRRSRGRNRS